MERPSELQIGKLVSQLTFTQLKYILIHLGLSSNEIDTIEHDHSGNYQNVMFICLQQWRLKGVGGTLSDIKIALEEEEVNTHILCKVNILACCLLH